MTDTSILESETQMPKTTTYQDYLTPEDRYNIPAQVETQWIKKTALEMAAKDGVKTFEELQKQANYKDLMYQASIKFSQDLYHKDNLKQPGQAGKINGATLQDKQLFVSYTGHVSHYHRSVISEMNAQIAQRAIGKISENLGVSAESLRKSVEGDTIIIVNKNTKEIVQKIKRVQGLYSANNGVVSFVDTNGYLGEVLDGNRLNDNDRNKQKKPPIYKITMAIGNTGSYIEAPISDPDNNKAY